MRQSKLSFIRACKSENGLASVYAVYEEFFGKRANEYLRDKSIIDELSLIADNHLVISVSEWMDDLSPERKEYFGVKETDSHLKHCILVLIKKIKLSENSILLHCEGL